jgi:hypothetical protein
MSTPGGIQVHPSCFHIVPNHTVIDRNRNAIVGGAIDGVTGAVTGGQITETFPPCAHPAVRARAATDSGASFGPFSASWIETSFVTINAPNYFSALVDEFVVPTGSIANSGQELGFFPALLTPSGVGIIQPVLQWGSLAQNGNCPPFGGGTPTWGVSAWAIGDDGLTLATPPTCGVNPGDIVRGYLEALSPCGNNGGDCYWGIEADDTTTNGVASEIVISTNEPMVFATEGTLEAGHSVGPGCSTNAPCPGLASCDQLPGGTNGITVFASTSLYENGGGSPSSVSWTGIVNNNSPACGYGVSNFSGGTFLTF